MSVVGSALGIGDSEQSESNCLMQLTCGNAFVVYNLRSEEREEVVMIHDTESFDDPIIFSHTGFVYNTSQRSLETNLEGSMGIQRPWPKSSGRVLFRSLAEVDLQ